MLDKALVLQILVTKLEASRTCDWYGLALSLADTGAGGEAKAKTKGKGANGNGGGKGGGKKSEGLRGTELHDMYHNVNFVGRTVSLPQNILPGLKAGRALWAEDEP
jgi:hypothetical protein